MRAAFIVPARNKERWVGKCVRSVLAQTYPCDVYVSDQGSTDGTLAVIEDLVAGHGTAHDVRVLKCPEPGGGMPGLNRHFNWLHKQLDPKPDCVIMCSADDINSPLRAEYVVNAFREHSVSYVNTTVQYLDPKGVKDPGLTSFPGKASRMLGVEETIRHQIGSCGSSAWAYDLYEKHGPLIGYEQQDMILPMMALAERGIWYIDLPLHTYVSHVDPGNTGLQGQMAAAKGDEAALMRLTEVNNFAHVRNWTSVLERWRRIEGFLGTDRFDAGAYDALMRKITETAWAWSVVKEALVLND